MADHGWDFGSQYEHAVASIELNSGTLNLGHKCEMKQLFVGWLESITDVTCEIKHLSLGLTELH